MPWEIAFRPEFEAWADTLSPADEESLAAALELLSQAGPALGRPLVDSIAGSRHKNMKELRPPSRGSAKVRVLFVFDPLRRAIMLLGGDKSSDWQGWYVRNLPVAEARYDDHLAELDRSRLAAKRRSR